MSIRDKANDDHGRALWHRYCNLPPDQKRDLPFISGFARRKGLANAEVSLGTAGRFRCFECVVVRAPDVNILLPCEAPEDLLAQWTEPLLSGNDLLTQVEWFFPAYLTKQFVSGVKRSVQANVQTWQEAFEAVLSLAYTPDYLATMVTDRYRAISAINPQIQLIEESFEAFHFGLTSVAITSLIPVVEGALSRILFSLCSRQDQTGEELVRQVMAATIENAARDIVYSGSWIPSEYRERSFLNRMDEYVEMLEVFEAFCLRYLFAKTAEYQGDARLRAIVHVGRNHGKWCGNKRL
jgi:hypothetical protein